MNKVLSISKTLVLFFTFLFILSSCTKDEKEAWMAYAKEAVLMGYVEGTDCSSGFIFDIISNENNTLRSLKYAHDLPVDAHPDLYRYFPMKVLIIYENDDNECSYTQDYIKVYKIEIVR